MLPATAPGPYRLIVRTDVFDEVFEGAKESNNRTASAEALMVTVPEIDLGVPFATTLGPGQERLFQVEVPAVAHFAST